MKLKDQALRFAATVELQRPEKRMGSEFKSCDFCRHHVRIQTGPHAWNHDCRLRQIEFPDAEPCSAYQPPPLPESASSGLGYVWDNEYEGRP